MVCHHPPSDTKLVSESSFVGTLAPKAKLKSMVYISALRRVLLLLSLLVLGIGSCIEQNQRRRTVYSQYHRHLSDQWILQSSLQQNVNEAPCPCDDVDLCRTISGPTIRPNGEVFGFVNWVNDTSFFNWTYISTVAWASVDEVMCQAHAQGNRAVLAAPSINLTAMAQDTQVRKIWIDNALTMVQSRYRDGLVFDYEEPLEANSPHAMAYLQLVQETTIAFHEANPCLQITVCVAWSPDGIDGRNYLYKELAEASDALYVMDYDTQSQILGGPCLANANAPYFGMVHGIQRYLSLGIAPYKLILGVPWYGYRYPCLVGNKHLVSNNDARYCPIPQVPFRGVNCSDAAGTEVSILTIHKIGRDSNLSIMIHRDDYMDAAYMNTIENSSTWIQYWFDDAISFRNKFKYSQSVGLAGIGPYSMDDLNPVLDPEGKCKAYAAEIWSTFDAFFVKEETQQSNS